MKRIATAFALLGSLALHGFYSAEPAPAAPVAPPAAARTAAADDDASLPPSQRLALAQVKGTSVADKGVIEAQAAVRRNMTKDDAWVVLGRAWVKKARESADPGFYLNADAAAAVVLDKDPDHAMALDVRGLVLLNGHKFEEARALAAKVVERHPESPLSWGNLSDALLELGRYDEAVAAAQRMIDLKPNLPSYSRASHLQWLRGDVGSAKATVRAALDAGRDAKRDPEPGAWVLVQAAMIFWNEGDVEGAEAGCDKALERIAGYAPATVCKGRVAMARGDAKRATELFERAYGQSPLVETAWLLGDAREAAGDHAGAEKAWALVEKEGRAGDPRTLSLFWSTKNRNVAEAVKLAEDELAVRKDVHTEDALAWALYRAGRIQEASEHMTRARRLGTPDPRLVYHEGAIRIAAGDAAKGRQLVLGALAKNRAFDWTGGREAQALVDEKLASR